jgi:cytochrome c-type biogenesis protein CcmH/NrfG
VARGTQHLKKRDRQPRPRPAVDRTTADRRRERKMAEQGMFFPKLRTHAKWMFVLLALVFAGGFVLFGVGSGSNGIGNVLSDWLNIGQSSSGPSASKLERKTEKEPRNAQAWRDLATAYETDQRTDDAVRALERLSALQPKNEDVLQELAGQYQRQLTNLSTDAATLQAETPLVNSSTFQPPPTTPLGRAFADPTGLQDPLAQALQARVSSELGKLQVRYSAVQTKLLEADKKVVDLDPTNPTAQYQLGQVADSTGDQLTAIAAYRQFLKLSPDDPLAAQVKARLKQLSPPAKSGSG